MRSGTVYQISELNKYVKNLLYADFSLLNVSIRGEIINLKKYASAYYFTMKENDEARISVVIFNIKGFTGTLHDGDEVIATGRVTLHEKSGTYQLIADEVVYAGLGAKLVALQKLKEKLDKMGLFRPELKKSLPKFPQTIGVIAPKDSAALADITTNIARRYPLVRLVVASATFQGDSAPSSLIHAVTLITRTNIDTLIIARGGGSSDDLWAFNDEELVLTLSKVHIPIITAIGHEIDTTLVDYVSDVRASTPTAAAELAVPSQDDLKQTLIDYEERLEQALSHFLEKRRLVILALRERPVLVNYTNVLNTLKEKVMAYAQTMKQLLERKINHFEKILLTTASNLTTRLPLSVERQSAMLANLTKKMSSGIVEKVGSLREVLIRNESKLSSLNPASVLKRGYAIISQAGEVVVSRQNLKIEQPFAITFHDGTIETKRRNDDE